MSDTPAETVSRARLDSLVDEIGDGDIVRQAVQSFLDELVERLQTIRTTITVQTQPRSRRRRMRSARRPRCSAPSR